MKNIDYKQLRSYSNLPKYDPGMEPISSGYLGGDNFIQTGTVDLQATPITNAFMPEALSKATSTISGLATGLGRAIYSSVAAGRKAGIAAAEAYGRNLGSSAAEAAKIGKGAAQSASKSAFSEAAGGVLSAAAAVHGGLESIATADAAGRAPLSAGDLLSSSSRNTEYINGVGYNTYGGYDTAGINKHLRDFNKANIIKQATSGMEFGSGVGGLLASVVPGIGTVAGTVAGAGFGLLGGLGVGLFNSGKAKEKMERVIDNTNRAIAGYNLQNEAEAANKAAKNSYYASHYAPADEGSNVGEKPNALVNNREVLGTVKNGRVQKAYTVDSNLPDRYDGIPVNLGPNDFVIGHKIGPEGVELNEQALLYERMFNSNDPRLQKIGELGLLATLKTQKRTPDNNPNPWEVMADKGVNMKTLRKCDAGLAYSIIPMGLGMAQGYSRLRQAQNEPILAFLTYAANPNALQALAMMPTRYDESAELNDMNDSARHAMYNIMQSPYSGGARMAMLSNLYNNILGGKLKIYANKRQQENALKSAYANLLYQSGEQEAARMQNSNAAYYQQLAQALARKRAEIDTSYKDIYNSLYKGFENMFNWDMFKLNVGLYREKLTQDAINDLVKHGKEADEARRIVLGRA